MSRRIGKRTREAAIHCLEQCASDRLGGVGGAWTEADLDMAAWDAVYRACPNLDAIDTYLEAAALLRDGWNPGDPVEVRR